MLIQKLVRHDSIIASQRLVAEFCNTIPPEADMTILPRDVAEVPIPDSCTAAKPSPIALDPLRIRLRLR